MNPVEVKLGLVLSGGGAKGAYHAGVIKYLAEAGILINAISGASIGALNGAIISNSDNLVEASKNLLDLWSCLASSSPLKLKDKLYEEYALYLACLIVTSSSHLLLSLPSAADGISNVLEELCKNGVYDDSHIKALIQKYTTPHGLNNGIPLYVSLYESDGGISAVAESTLAAIGLIDTKPSEFLLIQSLPQNMQQNAVFASASLPLIFRPQTINSRTYIDGGIGGWKKSQGNTPITPLVEIEKCTNIIVTHLSDASLWNRHDFKTASILEARPKKRINKDGILTDLLDFSADSINRLVNQGYEDAYRCIGNIDKALKQQYESEIIKKEMSHFLNKLDNDEFSMDDF